MFNFTYAIIGVLIGMAVEPVGRFAKHGPSASPQWTWNKIILPIVLLPFLQGCMSYTEAAKKSCSEYGFVQGTPEIGDPIYGDTKEPNMQKSTIDDLILYTLTQFTNDIM